MEKNCYWISFARAIAMLGVVGIHVAGYTGAAPGARDILVGKVAILVASLGLCAVPLFVMTSGALLLDPSKFYSLNHFIKKRLMRIMVPLLFWHFIYYLFIVFYLKWDLSVSQAIKHSLNGNLYTALYYFWVVLGLSIVTPVLIPYVREKNNGILLFAILACCIPVLSIALASLRPGEPILIHTPWTWWIPYLGYFLLGWAIKDLVLSGRLIIVALCSVAAIVFALYSTWNESDISILAGAIWPAKYYSLATHVYTVLIFLIIRSCSIFQKENKSLIGKKIHNLIVKLGEGTLGVFVLHLIVLAVLLRQDWFGFNPVSTSITQLLTRVAVVYFGTYTLVLLMRRVPMLRTVL